VGCTSYILVYCAISTKQESSENNVACNIIHKLTCKWQQNWDGISIPWADTWDNPTKGQNPSTEEEGPLSPQLLQTEEPCKNIQNKQCGNNSTLFTICSWRYNKTTQWFGDEDPHTTNTTGHHPEAFSSTPHTLWPKTDFLRYPSNIYMHVLPKYLKIDNRNRTSFQNLLVLESRKNGQSSVSIHYQKI
jgi:hypothetical protein